MSRPRGDSYESLLPEAGSMGCSSAAAAADAAASLERRDDGRRRIMFTANRSGCPRTAVSMVTIAALALPWSIWSRGGSTAGGLGDLCSSFCPLDRLHFDETAAFLRLLWLWLLLLLQLLSPTVPRSGAATIVGCGELLVTDTCFRRQSDEVDIGRSECRSLLRLHAITLQRQASESDGSMVHRWGEDDAGRTRRKKEREKEDQRHGKVSWGFDDSRVENEITTSSTRFATYFVHFIDLFVEFWMNKS